MKKLKLVLVMLACVHGMQAFAKSDDIRYEDFLLKDSSKVIHGTLDNGFQYYIVKLPMDHFQMSLVQKGGDHNDGETIEISHFLEHMMLTANRQLAIGGTLRSYLNKLGKDYGTGFNGYTAPYFMAYELYQLKSNRAYADSCMAILSEIAYNASICAIDREEQRERVLHELTNRKYMSGARIVDALFAAFTYGCDLEQWREKRLNSTKKITQSQLEAFYKKWYQPQRQCLVVSGKIPDGIEEMIKRQFGNHPSQPTPTPPTLDYQQRNFTISRVGSPTCNIILYFDQPLLTPSEKESPKFFRDYYALKKGSKALSDKIEKNKKEHINSFVKGLVDERFSMQMGFAYNIHDEDPESGLQALVDSMTVFLDDVRNNGVQISMAADTLKESLVEQRRSEAKTKLQEGNGKDNTLDESLPIINCFVHSLPIYKQEDSDAYWSYELSGKDISNYCKKFINESTLKIQCILPYGYPEKEITEKLNALLQRYNNKSK